MVCRWQCEIDRRCQKLLRAKWPRAKIYADITRTRPSETETVDVVCGGSPCTNLSVAGLRAGLAGSESGLFFSMVGICKHQRRRGGARWVVWENVDGAFSSNGGRDFAAVLRAFTGMQVEVPTDGWGRAGFIKTPFPAWRWNCAWRVFDARYFGVAQRRRRVFLVASAGDGSCAEILFEPESLSGNFAASGGEGEGTTAGALRSTDGGCDVDHGCAGHLIPRIADCLQERDAKGPDGKTKNGHLIPVAFDYKQGGDTQMGMSEPGCPPLRSRERIAVALPIQEAGSRTGKSTTEIRNGMGVGRPGEPMFSLQAKAQHAVAFDTTQITNPENRSAPKPGDPCHPLSAKAHPPAIAFSGRERGAEPAVKRPPRAPHAIEEAVGALDATKPWNVAATWGVRRLTPRECDRLMGWPEDHTAGFKDTVRYRMSGNGVVAPNAGWIARRIVRAATV